MTDYMKPQEALGLLCSAIRCGEEFGPAHEKARLSILSALAQAADAGRYKEALRKIAEQDSDGHESFTPQAMVKIAKKALSIHRCDLGVGCDEAGICYAVTHNRPEFCPRQALQGEQS